MRLVGNVGIALDSGPKVQEFCPLDPLQQY